MKSLTFLAFLSPAQCLVQGLGGLLSSVDAIISAAEMATSDKSFNSFIDAVEEGAAPTTVDQATFATELARNESNGNPLAYIGLLKLNGILNPLGEQASGCGEPCTAKNTGNPTLPGLYQQTQGDAPWSEPETSLTSSVYFPPQYTFGEKIPLLFVPGTGRLYSQLLITHTNASRQLRQTVLLSEYGPNICGGFSGGSRVPECPRIPTRRCPGQWRVCRVCSKIC